MFSNLIKKEIPYIGIVIAVLVSSYGKCFAQNNAHSLWLKSYIKTKGDSILYKCRYEKKINWGEIKEGVKEGGNIGINDSFFPYSLMQLVIIHNKINIIKQLYESQGLKGLETNDSWSTLLHYAVKHNKIKIVKLLLSLDADYRTPLYFCKSIKIGKLLIDQGAQVNPDNKEAQAPLFGVVDHNFRLVKLYVKNGADANSRITSGRTPLFFSNNFRTTKFLISKGADWNVKDTSGEYPFALMEDVNSIKLLLKKGININEHDHEGSTPLIYATCLDHYRIFKLFIESGADVNVKNKYGFSPMLSPNIRKREMRLLVKNNVDINILSKDRTSAVAIAVGGFDFSRCAYLLKKGANPNTVNIYGVTPLNIAMNLHQRRMVKLLRKYNAKTEEELKK